MKKQRPGSRMENGLQHRARKRFGQNFLHDQSVIQRIVESIAPQCGDHLLEIGPGQGALTEQLLRSEAKFDCVELDRDLAKYLNEKYQSLENFTLYQQDILKFDLKRLNNTDNSLRVIGNLPYNISTPVLFYLLRSHSLIKDMTFMLQLEVVQRMAANLGDKNYGRLSLMVQYFCEVEHLFNVPSAAFTPQPKVSSAIVRLRPHVNFPLQASNVKNLQLVVRTAFNQRRKTLRNSMKTLLSQQALEALPIDLTLRPENISLAEYITISDLLDD